MSCTVLTLPIALSWVVGAVASGIASEIAKKQTTVDTKNSVEIDGCEDINIISTQNITEKIFETPFVDGNLLVKTLSEHGAVAIDQKDTEISARVENYVLNFVRNNTDEPFKLHITCLEKQNFDNHLKDIGAEYTVNVQEDAYNHIIEKLQENNMTLENEEIQDDNTIVLTINID